ncbi:hypothetical protein CMV_015031 [Castanea mollissima]|uniref:Squalene cyclase N-terminal domain-containing protein n=1 Tax=Castanea mollissima TaxID=60419 RepID=A0A8J4RAS4_9ROSI|nr:hypothetical protein CMV_015031 [Castanea mollissima]
MWKLKNVTWDVKFGSSTPEELGTPEELQQIEDARRGFSDRRFEKRHSSDVLMRIQFAKENPSFSTAHDGHWPGDYGDPMFLIPGLVITLSITGALNAVLSKEHIREISKYLYNHQNKDGGWGLHIEGPSTMFGTALNYVTLRLLGEGAEDELEAMEQARKWILDHGGAIAITSWGKCGFQYLECMNGLGIIHCRQKYGSSLTFFLVIQEGCGVIAKWYWNETRNLCAKEDLYYPHPLVQDILWGSLHYAYEPVFMCWPAKRLREKALQTVMLNIHYEDENTRYICIGPVNKVLNMLCCWVEDPNSEAFKLHLPRIFDYLWIAEDGMKMQGYNGTTLRKAHDYIKDLQILEDCLGDLNFWYRHISKGAWPFSSADHGWPISVCTAEGLKADLLLSTFPSETVGKSLDVKRLYDAVNVSLSLQVWIMGSGWGESYLFLNRWSTNPSALIKSLSTNPEFLRNKATDSKIVVDYKDWQITLSRRFQAMKLWLVLRSYGVANLRNFLRSHVKMAKLFEELVRNDNKFEVMAPRNFALVCFRVLPWPNDNSVANQVEYANELNKKLLESINGSGNVYMSSTVVDGAYIIRCVIGATLTEERHVIRAWKVIQEHADALLSKN